MLESLTADSYRSFRHYRMAGLARVNLLVGPNNCGKTSLLEAVRILSTGADPLVLGSTAWQRGEMIFGADKGDAYPRARDVYPDISHFFHGHELDPDSAFSLSSDDGLGRVTVRVVPAEEDDLGQLDLFEPGQRASLVPAFAIQIEGGRRPDENGPRPLATEDGALLWERRPSSRRHRRLLDEVPLLQFISQESLEPRHMADMWDKLVLDGREGEIIEAMRILEPRLQSIVFLSGETVRFGAGRTGSIVVGFRDQRRRSPLGSQGEGTRRLLALSLSLLRSEHGILLVDEIDTGLHHSVMTDMWRLIVDGARRSDVQVFATTHSLDCVRGLADLCEQAPELADCVSLQKIDRALDESVAFDARRIRIAVEQEIEVR